MKFLIQTIYGEVEHDFSFTLRKSIDWQNWKRMSKDFQVVLSNEINVEGCIPIGSNEFVRAYLFKYYNLSPKPINIPTLLLPEEFTGRKVINGTNKDIIGESFVKSNDEVKGFTEFCDEAPDGNYQISELVEIDSEYRCFVYHDELVGIQNYVGDFTLFPNVEKINKMIDTYKPDAPVAYTLDVGIVNGETVVIEVHDFYSCGLYGFANHNILPFMFIRWFNEYTGKIKYK